MNQSNKSKKFFVWIPVMVLLFSFVIVFSSKAFTSDVDRYITFNGQTWNMDDYANKPGWITNNKESISFTVDLSEDYQKYLEQAAPAENEEAPPIERPFVIEAAIGDEVLAAPSISEIKDIDANFDGQYQVVLPLPANKDGDVEIKVKFKEGSWIEPEHSNTFQIKKDSTLPEVSLTKGDGREFLWYEYFREGVTAHLSTTDENLVPEGMTISVTRNEELYQLPSAPIWTKVGNTYTTEIEFKYDGDYEISYTAEDIAGNVSKEKKANFTIVTGAPELQIHKGNTTLQNNGYYHSGDIEIKALSRTKISDAAIKVMKAGSNGGESTEYPVGEFTLSKRSAALTHEFLEEGTYTVYVTVTELYGNKQVHELEPFTFTIDNTDPVLEISGVQNGYFTKAIKPTVKISDANLDPSSTWVTLNGVPFENGTILEEEMDYILFAKVTDKAGHVKVKTVRFTIDKTTPELEISGVTNGFSNTVLAPEITYNDQNLDSNKTSVTLNGQPYNSGTPIAEEGKEHILRAVITDKAGHVTEKTFTFTIDTTYPTLELKGVEDGAFYNSQSVTPTVDYDDLNIDSDAVKTFVTLDGKPFENGTVLKAEKEYVLTAQVTDLAGNKVTETRTFTIDRTLPKITFGGFDDKDHQYSQDGKLIITIDEIKKNFHTDDVKIDVKKSGSNYEIKGIWNQDEESSTYEINFDKNDPENEGTYEITVNAKDKANNTAEQKTISFTIDHTKPFLHVDYEKNSTGFYQNTKTVTFTASDNNLDLEQTEILVNSKPYAVEWTKDATNIAKASIVFEKDGEYTIGFQTTDLAKNNLVYQEPVQFILDNTEPVVNISGVDHQQFYPTVKDVMVTVDEQNYSTNDVTLSVNNGALDMGTWVNAAKLSSLSYRFSKDGQYNVQIAAKDKAGNGPIIQVKTFTIDQTKPSIEINGVDQNAYYNTDKPVSVAINDKNLNINNINVTKDGSSYYPGEFSVKGENASLSHHFSKEGKYDISVEATDKAGNSYSIRKSFTIDKTKPVITPKFKGENRLIQNGEYINQVFTPQFVLDQGEDEFVSITLNGGENLKGNIPLSSKEMLYHYNVHAKDKAGNETTLEISYTVDTTKPKLTISGVVDGFFNKDIEPTVTYSDIHLDPSKSSVTLNGKPFTNGQKLEKETDYVLKATITDLAKNISTRTIVFSIDKTAPVIKFKEAITGKYFNENIIPDLLINDMSDYDIISLTLDGNPYTIGAPIKEEGKHVLYFEVKDKAGNIQQLSVEFIIDKTAPKVIYNGVKKNEIHYETVSLGIHLENPNDRIKSITINGELLNGEPVTQNGVEVIKATLAEKKKYEVKVTAYDEAGNEISSEFPFEIAEKGALVKFYENQPLFASSIAGLLLLVIAGGTVMVKRRKNLQVDED